MTPRGPPFDVPVPPGGYAWWYLDAISDDGRHALTLIAFVGSVFSPYYALARRGGRAAPAQQHCALNLALYALQGQGPQGWAMTERGASAIVREAMRYRIGPSQLAWQGAELRIAIDEVTAPWPRRIRGEIRLRPGATGGAPHRLAAAGDHWWQPVAPVSRVELRLDSPQLAWQGHAYFDANWGARPLAQDFESWHWSRASLADGGAAVLYDLHRADGSRQSLALRFGGPVAAGTAQAFEPPPAQALPATAWRLARQTRATLAPGAAPLAARVVRTLEDGPFYARSLLATRLLGQEALAMHESLSLARWRQPLVQAMLPFRMPRRGT